MKKCWLLLLLMGCFLFGSQEVQARVYVTKEVLRPNGYQLNKKFIHGTGNGVVEAYCSEKNKQIYTVGKPSMILDSDYKNRKCQYLSNGKIKTAKCSVTVGYVIAAAREIGETVNVSNLASEHNSWYWAQLSLWVYLSKYGDDAFKAKNHPSKSQSSSKTINKILTQAFSDIGNSGTQDDQQSSNDRIIEVVTDNSGVISLDNVVKNGAQITYKSDIFTIENLKGVEIQVVFQQQHSGIKIYGKDGKPVGETIVIGPKEKVSLYLQSNKHYDSSDFYITAEYSKKVSSKTKTYSSKRYVYADSGKRDDGQGMIVLVNDTKSSNGIINYEDTKTFKLNIPELIQKSCPKTPPSEFENAYESGAETITGTCSPAGGSSSLNSYEYYGCDTRVIKVNGKEVSYVLQEATKFSYGNLSPNQVYAGQGFELSASNALQTSYADRVEWNYAYYIRTSDGEKPYVNGLEEANVQKEINKALKDTMEARLNNILMVTAQDSNDSKIRKKEDEKRKNLQLALARDKDAIVELSGRTLQYSTVLKFPTVYLNTDGTVTYEENESKEGKNVYYTPFVRNPSEVGDTEFDFNISSGKNGLSLVGFQFYFSGDCVGSVKYGNIAYRAIDVNNPFPIPGKMSVNWENWITPKKEENYNRLSKSYDDEKLEYSVTLDKVKIDKINKNSGSIPYSDWSLVSGDGKSDFIDWEYGFTRWPTTLCPVGGQCSNDS